MQTSKKYKFSQFVGFWCNKVLELVNNLKLVRVKSKVSQHDIALSFINKELFEGNGIYDNRFRKKGEKYFDLKVPSKNKNKDYDIIEFKLFTEELKNIRQVLKNREEIFQFNDYLYFSYFLRLKFKNKSKLLKTHHCIYYLVVIIFDNKIVGVNMKELVNEIKENANDFKEHLIDESELYRETCELMGVDNIIRVDDLERELEEIKEEKEQVEIEKRQIEAEKKKLEKMLKEKEMVIKKLKDEIEKLKNSK